MKWMVCTLKLAVFTMKLTDRATDALTFASDAAARAKGFVLKTKRRIGFENEAKSYTNDSAISTKSNCYLPKNQQSQAKAIKC